MDITSSQPAIQVGGNGMDGFGGGFGMMFLAFLAIMGMGGGMFGNRGPNVPNNVATTDTVNQAVQFSSLQDQNRDITGQIGNMQSYVSERVSDKYGELARDIAANSVSIQQVLAQQSQCCCEVKQQIAALNLENEKRFAALNLDNEKRYNALSSKMDQQEIQRLRDQLALQSQSIQDLKSDIRMQGVFRMPQGYTFNAGPGPFAAQPLPFPAAAGF